MNKTNKIDTITLDVPLFIRMLEFAKEDAKTDMELHSATENALKLSKKGDCLSMANYNDIVNVKTKKIEANEQTMADASGSFEAPMGSAPIIKRPKIGSIPNMKKQDVDEITDASSSGAYDVPFGKGGKNPLKIDGVKSIKNSRAVKDKKFPKWGGPGSTFVKVKDKCKKFPYCNQGDINAIEKLNESIDIVSKKTGIPRKDIQNLVMKEIKKLTF